MLLLSALACFARPVAAPPPAAVEVADPAPAARATPLDEAGLAALLATPDPRPLVVNVWATWCAPCMDELPELGELARAWPSTRFVLVNVDAAAPLADHPVALDTGIPRRHLAVPDAAATLRRTVPGFGDAIPVTLVVGPDGSIVERYSGRFDKDLLEAAIARAGGLPPP